MKAIDYVNNKYIRELASKNLREDGRGMFDYRSISVICDVISNAEGSAQVDLGATKVLAGVKVVEGEPMRDNPNMGNLIVSAELLPLADPTFERGPPSPESIELARVIDRGIRAGECIDLESLFIEEGKVWTVFIDLYILNYDGNLFDASMLAAMTALTHTKVPTYRDGQVITAERKVPLKINNIISSVTFAKVGDTIMLDPTGNERDAAAARLTIETDGKEIRAMQKGLNGSFTRSEISNMIDIAFNKHKELISYIKKS